MTTTPRPTATDRGGSPRSFADLLASALDEPGLISHAYTAFHGYSIGNQLLAWVQCLERGIAPGPIATFVGWKERGRYVRKGQRAIVLCVPITCKRRPSEANHDVDSPAEAEEAGRTFTRFVYKPHWFVLTQTDGADVDSTPIPGWNQIRALKALGVVEEAFAHSDGNCQGYARGRAIAVSPVAAHPHKTRFHELAHVVLGHTSDAEAGLTDAEVTPRNLREVEAEAVALLCVETLGLPGAEYCRGYLQSWNHHRGGEPIPERSAQRILKAADQILRAGEEKPGQAGPTDAGGVS